jgi:isopentenyl diphosphate isomerase/L-lactate dehydrogenase-like FMN-dependent dehydrogenase
MAKNKHYRWRDWRVDQRGTSINDSGERKPKRNKARKGSGITNEQAKFLAALQRQAGLKYTGAGMSRADASTLIDKLVAERDARRSARPMRRDAA